MQHSFGYSGKEADRGRKQQAQGRHVDQEGKAPSQNRQKESNHTCHCAINCSMSITDPRGRHQASRGSKGSQPSSCKQKPSTTADETDKQWTSILQSHHEGCVRHTSQHRHKSTHNTKRPEAHTTRDGTANRRGVELFKSGHQVGRKR